MGRVHVVDDTAAAPIAVPPAAVQSAVDAVESALARLDVPRDAQLSLVFTDDTALADANRRYRGVPGPTDVLSFAADPRAVDPGGPPYLGDVLISVQRAQSQADELGHPLTSELRLLAVHGLLHLLGFDDETEDGAEAMEAAERRLGVRDEEA
jgi:probable rRNA maturation factor